jgi:uncharacterized delta-60 repeat protein
LIRGLGPLTGVLATALLLAFAGAAYGAAGEPDPSFGNQGFTVLDDQVAKNEFLEDVVVLPDGKILGAGARGAAGGFLLARLNPDGTPDLGFGSEGIRVEPDLEAEPGLGTPGSPRGIAAIGLRGDGKLVVAGLGRGLGKVNAFEFGRYLPNGALDPTFGNGGLTTVWFEPAGSALALAQAPDGKLVATGDNAGGGKAVVARVTESGSPDATFHAVTPAGVRFVDVPGSPDEEGRAVGVLPSGTVVIGGVASNGAFLAELDASGNPVAGFGEAGIAVQDLGSEPEPSGEIEDLKVLPDGRILATGSSLAGPGDLQAFVARFTSTGDLDPSFASGGIFFANPTPGLDETEALEMLPDGRILAAGTRGESGPETADGEAWLFRLTPEGRLDPSFGRGGEAFASAGPGTDGLFGLALQSDGRAVVAGDTGDAGSKLLLGRFTADPTPTAEPERPRCGRRRATIVGTKGADQLAGTKRADVIAALSGNDRINAGGGNDLVCAGPGKDVTKAGKGRDRVRGEAGADSERGGPGKDRLVGGSGPDQLFGGPGPDKLLGGAANDALSGGGGPDSCNGGAGKHDRGGQGCEKLRQLP